jgi:hypothetical protein
LDIKDLYVNIPISETIKISKSQLLKNSYIQTTNQITTLLEIILNQNSFSFQGQVYQPDKGIAMGSPISGTMAEIFLQHLGNTHVKHLIESNILSFYTRYIDDILIIYDSTLTTPDNIQWYLSTIHNNIQFSLTHENNHSVSFLDLTITRKPSHLDISIYQKPTTTDTTINFLSNHPPEQKLAAYRFLINRMPTLPIPKEQSHEEWQNILHIAHGNNFPRSLITNLKHRMKEKLTQLTPPTTSRHDTKWTTFTYTSPQIRKITTLFKHTNLKIAFKCNTTIAQLLTPANNPPLHTPYDRSGIYLLTCNTSASLCGSNQPELKATLPRAHKIHQK